MANIPIAKPLFGPEELAAVAKPLESGWVVQGPYVAEFEKRFGAFVGAEHSVACSNGTTALHLAYAAMRLGEGDEVIVPAFTWVATANAVVYCGAQPVFCDIDLATFNIDPAAIEACITPRTKGIVPVHLFGLCADMAPILELAKKHGLWVVEDAACGFGATYRGQQAGTIAETATFSFHPRKSITMGEGGMVTTSRADVAALVRSQRDHGVATRRDEPPFLLPDYDELGFNYRLTDLQAAIGCAQLDRAEHILARRRDRARLYDEQLASLEWLRTPIQRSEGAGKAGREDHALRPTRPGPSLDARDDSQHGYQAYVCLFAPEEPTIANVDALEARRNELMTRLDERGITTRQGTHAPVLRKFYREKFNVDPAQFPNAVLAEKLSFALPLYPQMTDQEQARVIDALREIGPC